jgi:ParB family transcriptional regulator, chromosome partitioning protein
MTRTDTRKPSFGNVPLLASTNPQIANNTISIDLIDLPASQPRKYFNPEKEKELANSIKIHGILEPLIVRPKDDRFELVAGERRLRAAKSLALKEVPIVSREFGDEEAKQISLIENLQRENLSPLEETQAILELVMIRRNVDQDEAIKWLRFLVNQGPAAEIPKDVTEIFDNLSMTLISYVKHRLGLLKLPEDTLTALAEGKIEYTKATEIGKIKDQAEREALLEKVISDDLPIKEVKEEVKQAKQKAQDAKGEKKEVKDKPTKAKEQVEDYKKSIADLYEKVVEKRPWDNPNNQQQVNKLIKAMQDILKNCEVDLAEE